MTIFRHQSNTTRVSTALLLAAGTGTRLHPLTQDAPKCLTEVDGIPLLKRLVDNLSAQGFTRLVVVIGYMGERIQHFLQHNGGGMQIEYVLNPDYRSTNNLYSLWLARNLIREPFLLAESDLIFETWMLDEMLQPDRMAISKMLPWMNGTRVELGAGQHVAAFRMGDEIVRDTHQYKTVNLYSISLPSWDRIEKRLNRYVSEGRLNDYYEVAFAEMVADGTLSFDAVFFDANLWYEIDTIADLRAAEKLFVQPRRHATPTLILPELGSAFA